MCHINELKKKESGAGVVAVQGEDIYCRFFNITDVCYQIEVVFLTDSSDSDKVKTYTHMHVTHLCTHLLIYTYTRAHTHTDTHS